MCVCLSGLYFIPFTITKITFVVYPFNNMESVSVVCLLKQMLVYPEAQYCDCDNYIEVCY